MQTAREQLGLPPITLEQAEAEYQGEETAEKVRFTEVQRGPEFERIRRLPRRPPPKEDDPEAIELAAYITSKLAKVENPYPGPLRPLQAVSLKEAAEQRGFAGLLQPGAGKTLLSYLMPVAMGVKKALYVCPASMISEVQSEFQKFHRDWHGPAMHEIPIVSYEMFSTPSSGEVLDNQGNVLLKSLLARMAPELIILDECHRCASTGNTITKRIDSYLEESPATVVVAYSGTFFKTSIKDGQHIIRWCLADACPLPSTFLEREMWASYLDVKKSAVRAGIGALVDFLEGPERRDFNRAMFDDERRDIVRRAVARWMLSTPGIVGTSEPAIDTPLSIEVIYPKKEDPIVEEAFETFRELECLPDGTPLPDGPTVARFAQTFGLGFWSMQYAHGEFIRCLTNALKLDGSTMSSIEQKILTESTRTTGRDTDLVRALESRISSSPSAETGKCATATESPSKSISSSSRSSRASALSAVKSPREDLTINGTLPDALLLSWTTATLRETSVGYCAPAATSRLELWGTLLKRYPRLWNIFAEANEASRPSVEYREAWGNWAKWCRKMVKYNKRGIDSEARMKAAVRKGLYDDEGALEAWELQDKTYWKTTGHREPPSVPQWLSDEAVETAREWVQEYGGLVWVSYIGLGERIAAACGMPYYGEEGLCTKTKRHIKKHPGGPAVASIAANGTGRNLQGFWSDNLWLCTPTEQALARTHRAGQKAPIVRNWVYVGCAEHLKSFWYAYNEKSVFAEIMQGCPQRLRYAELTMPTQKQLSEEKGGDSKRWNLPDKE